MSKDASAPVCIFLQGANNAKTAEIVGLTGNGQASFILSGNTDFLTHTRTPAKNKLPMPVLWFSKAEHRVAKPDIFVNCIADADGMEKSLVKTIFYVDSIKKKWPEMPVFNEPRRIALTRRDIMAKKCQGLKDLIVPKTLRCAPKTREEVLKIAKKEGFKFPYIVRPTGQHNGRGMVLVESEKKADVLDSLAFDGSTFFIIQYHDYKNKDGLYTKLRLVVIGDKVYPRHMLMSKHWNVHATCREELMEKDAGLRALERDTLKTLADKISPDAVKSMYRIYRATGLDYLGFDCSILPDGKLLCFEINAAMNAMQASDYKNYPYLKPFTDAIVAAYNERLNQKVLRAQKKA